MTIKVIGAGFGRTGTMSLKAALEELGFDKCYHMKEVMARPKEATFWYRAGRSRSADWDDIFAGYQATVDWPGAAFYPELIHTYPDAKVILTVRDPQRWHQSTLNTIYIARGNIPGWLRWLVPSLRHIDDMLEDIIWDGTFQGEFANKQVAIDIFNRHIAEVKRTIPAAQLLVYDVKEGWEPLCRFLDVPIPEDKPFPHLNDTAEFQQMIKQQQRIMRLAPIAALGVGSVTIAWLLRRLSSHE